MPFPFTNASPLYQLFAILAVLVGIALWWRAARTDHQLLYLYGFGLIGGLLGAKIAYLLAEGWFYLDHPQRWTIWLTGKSVMGALPGGWIGVEIAKKCLRYPRITGDRFAITLPVPMMLGRIGCLQAGCCLGIDTPQGRWPTVEVEMAFLALMLLFLLLLRAKHRWPTQHFHVFLIGYGLFRFGHEFLRATPKPFHGLSGYQLIALATVTAAAWAFRHRHRQIKISPALH